ncbi:MAG: ATP cone domain-containing protein [Candidatus Omnitrophica bacterium]|nr:ATP cone domain-containing protein [Candidatus Omnitrophota bacterium]
MEGTSSNTPWSCSAGFRRSQIQHVARQVSAWCRSQAQGQSIIFIEDIQDAVVAGLKQSGHPEIAAEYEAYRRRHDQRRL